MGSLSRATGEDVGTKLISSTLTNSNYTITYVSANLTITVRPITVTADNKSKIYGDSDPALTYQITTGSLVFTDAFTGAITREAGNPVASYSITQGDLGLSTNYDLTFVPGTLTINLRPITITADAKSKVYGDTDPALTYQITTGSLAYSDTLTGSLNRATGEDVGTKLISSTLANSNYAITYVSANLTITARSITITADAKSKTYGDADPALTYNYTGNLQFSDEFEGALTRVAGTNAGSYEIQQGTLALSSNYSVSYTSANLTINPKAITVTAAAKNKTYGDTDPELTYTNTELVGGDAFTGALTRVAGEDAGTYNILQGTLALSSNYTISYTGAVLTVSKRAITVTVDAKSRTYGDADPGLTYQVTAGSLADGDNFTGALTRETGNNVGEYDILQGTLTLNTTNYNLTFVPGILTINLRAITITAINNTKVFNEADPTLSVQITAGSLAYSDAISGAPARDAGEDVGSYTIHQGEITINSNYTITFVTGTFTIIPLEGELEITLANNTLAWTGEEIGPVIQSVKLGGLTLTEGIDYTIESGATGTEIGPYTLTIIGTVDGNFEGSSGTIIWNIE